MHLRRHGEGHRVDGGVEEHLEVGVGTPAVLAG
jgi:hypothetical protein